MSKRYNFGSKSEKFRPFGKNIESHMGAVFISNVENDRFMARSSIAEVLTEASYTEKMASFHTARMIIE